MHFAPRSVGRGDHAAVAAELVCTGEALNLVDLRGEDGAQGGPHSRHTHEPGRHRFATELGRDPLLLRFHLLRDEIVQRERFA